VVDVFILLLSIRGRALFLANMFLQNDLRSFKTCIHENVFEKFTNTYRIYWKVVFIPFIMFLGDYIVEQDRP
jgi:hypothetical protein